MRDLRNETKGDSRAGDCAHEQGGPAIGLLNGPGSCGLKHKMFGREELCFVFFSSSFLLLSHLQLLGETHNIAQPVSSAAATRAVLINRHGPSCIRADGGARKVGVTRAG